MKLTWEGPVSAGHGWSGDLGKARLVLHENGWLQVQMLDLPSDDAGGEHRAQVLETAIRSMLAERARLIDELLKLAERVTTADVSSGGAPIARRP